MKVHITIPWSETKNLGQAYNETMSLIPDGDWACLMDTDTIFLTPDAGTIIQEYAIRFPDAGLLTCYTNRVSPLSRHQLLTGVVDENSDIKYHIRLAEGQKRFLYQVNAINRDISGMLMLVSKEIWKQFPFDETGKCLGVDTEWNRRLRAGGKQILLMRGLYIFHTYRIMKGIFDKKHLLV